MARACGGSAAPQLWRLCGVDEGRELQAQRMAEFPQLMFTRIQGRLPTCNPAPGTGVHGTQDTAPVPQPLKPGTTTHQLPRPLRPSRKVSAFPAQFHKGNRRAREGIF